MGPEVEYFPNVSAICSTLQLDAIIAVPGFECQHTGHDGVTNSGLTGGVFTPPFMGNRPERGGNRAISGFSKRGPWASEGHTMGQ